jgi:ribose transport system ATP-binding protein
MKIPTLELKGISKSFGVTHALTGVNLKIQKGEIRALVGENGAGKSTLVKILSGLLFPDQGSMFWEGKPYQPQGPKEAQTQGITLVPQEPTLAPHLSVAANLLLGREPARWGRLDGKKGKKQAQEILRQINHPEIKPTATVRNLSVSARQLVQIGRALLIRRGLVILDEPTSSLSPRDRNLLFQFLKQFRSQGGSVLYISHFLEEVEEIADSVTVLRDGQVILTENASELTRNQMVQAMVGREIREIYPRTPGSPEQGLWSWKGKQGQFQIRRGEVIGIFGLVGSGRTTWLRSLRPQEIKMGRLSEDRIGEGLALHLNVQDNLTLSHLKNYQKWLRLNLKKINQATHFWIEKLEIHCRSPKQKITTLSGGNQQKVALARLLDEELDLLLLDEPTRGIDIGAKQQLYRWIDQLARKQAKGILWVSSYLPELLGLCDRVAVMRGGRLGSLHKVEDISEQQVMAEAFGVSS